MTLNEKLYKKTGIYIMADNCEKIADEFAIGFGDWFAEHRYEDKVGYYEAKELLEIYKKEKGL